MAYDERLAERIRRVLGDRHDVTEKAMFGGRCFMVGGHMCVGVGKGPLLVRVGPEAHDELVRQPHARPMDFTGRPMKGFLYIAAAGLEKDADLKRWVGHGLRCVATLPAKARPSARRPPRKRARR